VENNFYVKMARKITDDLAERAKGLHPKRDKGKDTYEDLAEKVTYEDLVNETRTLYSKRGSIYEDMWADYKKLVRDYILGEISYSFLAAVREKAFHIMTNQRLGIPSYNKEGMMVKYNENWEAIYEDEQGNEIDYNLTTSFRQHSPKESRTFYMENDMRGLETWTSTDIGSFIIEALHTLCQRLHLKESFRMTIFRDSCAREETESGFDTFLNELQTFFWNAGRRFAERYSYSYLVRIEEKDLTWEATYEEAQRAIKRSSATIPAPELEAPFVKKR